MKNSGPERHWLDNLLQQVSQNQPEKAIKRPSDKVIHAFLTNNATEEQRKELILALSNSSAFRKELKDIAEDMEVLEDEELLDRIARYRAKNTPDLAAYLPDGLQGHSLTKRAVDVLGKSTSLKILVPALAAAAAIFFMLIPDSKYELVSKNIERAYLMSNEVRTPLPALGESFFQQADSAALDGFLSLIYVDDDDNLQLNEIEDLPDSFKTETVFNFSLLNRNEDSYALFTAYIQPGIIAKNVKMELWFLNLRERNLYKTPVSSNSMNINWNEEFGDEGCLVLTIGTSNGYRSIPLGVYDWR